MYPYQYYRYINLPRVPNEIVGKIKIDPAEYNGVLRGESYKWSDDFNQEVNDWCQKNICNDVYFAFQMMTTDHHIHRDKGTKTKFIYLLDTGGDSVVTNFYDDDQTTIVDSVVLEPHRWCILKVDSYHSVAGVENGKTRFAITGKIF